MVENHFIELNARENIKASEFEILTATAFEIFNKKKVDVGIVEVGMGGRLDSTNILQNQVVSVINKIARDHEGFLGSTLESIALHKAGILRPNVPYIVNSSNPVHVIQAIDQYAKEIGAGPRIDPNDSDFIATLSKQTGWRKFGDELLPFQRENAILAYLAVLQVWKSMDLSADVGKTSKYLLGCKSHSFMKGRMDVKGTRFERKLLIDGAHNPDAAQVLRDFITKKMKHRAQSKLMRARKPVKGWPTTWVVAMTDGKDAEQYFSILLSPGDIVIATTFPPVDGMPWVKPMDPQQLLDVAKKAQPGIAGFTVPEVGALPALCAAWHTSKLNNSHVVLTGSLYLVGDYYRCEENGVKPPTPSSTTFGGPDSKETMMLAKSKRWVDKFLDVHPELLQRRESVDGEPQSPSEKELSEQEPSEDESSDWSSDSSTSEAIRGRQGESSQEMYNNAQSPAVGAKSRDHTPSIDISDNPSFRIRKYQSQSPPP